MGWHNAEYVIGWKAVIRRILRVFEASTRMEDIEADLLASLLTWVRQSWMGCGSPRYFHLSYRRGYDG